MNSEKLINFYKYLETIKWDGSVCYYEGKYHAIINPKNNIGVAHGISETLDGALEECKKELQKLGNI